TFTYVNGTSSSSVNPQVIFNQPGVYDVELTATNSLGSHTRHYISAVAPGGFPLPFVENFEAANSFDRWSVPAGDTDGWERAQVAGNSPGSYAARSNLYFNTGSGPFELVSPGISFVGHSNVSMDFDYAYRGRGGNTNDTLRVYVATQCQSNWVLVQQFFEDGSSNFVTSTPRNSDFVPSLPSDWCGNPGFGSCKTVDLSAFDGLEGVRIKFEVGKAGGNNIYVDNINITGNSSIAPTAAFSGPKSACALRPVSFTDQSYGSPSSYEWTFTGGTPAVSTDRVPSVSYAAAGTYEVKLKVVNGLGSDSISKSSFITITPADSVLIDVTTNQSTTLCFNDTLQMNLAVTNPGANAVYDWYRNGARLHSGSVPSYNYIGLLDGDEVYAIVTSSEECAFPQN
ncbi:MAG: PKD domain-containing protein, partial [Owenweeksia sp.]